MRLRFLKALLRRFGVIAFKRSTGIYLPEDEMPQLVQRLCDKPAPVVVDGGAHLGDFVHAIRSRVPEARFVCFEPDPELSAGLGAAFAGDASVTVVAAALGDKPGRAQFHLNQSRATNSLLAGTAQNTGALRELVATQTMVDVEVTTLDAALERSGHTHVDIIKLDLQGYDYLALKGATRALQTASVVVCEVWFAPVYEGAAEYLEVCTWMREQGFALYALTSLHYGRNDRLLWGDAVFVPRTSPAMLAPITH